MGYRKCSEWTLRTAGGKSLAKGIEAMCLSVSGGVRSVDMVAHRYSQGRGYELNLRMTLAGMQFSIEKGSDLIQNWTGLQVALFRQEKDRTLVQVNEKNETELKTTDFVGPCALISYDFAKLTVTQEVAKYGGGTILYLGMGTTVVDTSPNWLERVVDNADRATLGGNFMKFNANNLPMCNARAASRIELNERSLGAKLEISVAMFSGNIIATGMHKY